MAAPRPRSRISVDDDFDEIMNDSDSEVDSSGSDDEGELLLISFWKLLSN